MHSAEPAVMKYSLGYTLYFERSIFVPGDKIIILTQQTLLYILLYLCSRKINLIKHYKRAQYISACFDVLQPSFVEHEFSKIPAVLIFIWLD